MLGYQEISFQVNDFSYREINNTLKCFLAIKSWVSIVKMKTVFNKLKLIGVYHYF